MLGMERGGTALEAPSEIKRRVVEEGKYVPKIKEKNVVKKQDELRAAGLLRENQNLKDLFEDEEPIITLAGEVIFEEEITEEEVELIERELSKYAKGIFDESKQTWRKQQVYFSMKKYLILKLLRM